MDAACLTPSGAEGPATPGAGGSGAAGSPGAELAARPAGPAVRPGLAGPAVPKGPPAGRPGRPGARAAKPPDSGLCGLALFDKPAGVSTFSLVKDARRILSVRKAGHVGTLDPMATGLAGVLVGP
ncbi:MAG: hypothetical protein LBQ12_06010, partial [Deltaproteobacteria bacterium]|nr:hypothetical protein [Deltaproteobacteria bacterium]